VIPDKTMTPDPRETGTEDAAILWGPIIWGAALNPEAGAVMKEFFLGSIALVTLIAGPAMAADMAVYKAPVPVVVPSWTGLYVGAGVGFRSTQTDFSMVGSSFNGGPNFFAAQCAANAALFDCIRGEPLNDTAFRFSPYIGYNYQVGSQWVVGVEADFGWASKTTTLAGMRYPATTQITQLADSSFNVKTTWDASVRGRAGFLVTPTVLVYATGGAAWLHVEATSVCSTNPNFGACAPATGETPPVITDAKTKAGWTAGGGIEAMLWSNWLARGEYRYADFGTITNTDTRFFGGLPGSTNVYDLRVRTHTATFGLAYKFGGADPVAAAVMPVKAPVYKAPPTVVASWTGLYIGAAAGMRSTQTDVTVTDFNFGGFTLATSCTNNANNGGCVVGEPLNDTAFRLGPYAGFNWQVAPQWIVGVEGDWGWASKTTTLAGMVYPTTSFITALTSANTFSVKTTWDASARGRIGFLVTPTVLVYATAGAAWLHVESTSNCSLIPFAGVCGGPGLVFTPGVITDSKTTPGVTVGGGIEAMLWSNWFARAEYRYADFRTIHNTDTRTCSSGPCGAPPATFVASYDVHVRTHTALFGLAYKFDRAGPVVAKY
jgi:outer membrane immunogenic protein